MDAYRPAAFNTLSVRTKRRETSGNAAARPAMRKSTRAERHHFRDSRPRDDAETTGNAAQPSAEQAGPSGVSNELLHTPETMYALPSDAMFDCDGAHQSPVTRYAAASTERTVPSGMRSNLRDSDIQYHQNVSDVYDFDRGEACGADSAYGFG